MLSLSNVYDQSKLDAWARDWREILPRGEFTSSPNRRSTGFAVALTYTDGLLQRGLRAETASPVRT